MKIDIDRFSEEELIDLNHRVVERLCFLIRCARTRRCLISRSGDRVTFQPQGRLPVVGMLTRYNKKTVTVITDSGQHWNVAPGFLRKAVPTGTTETSNTKVVPLKRDR